MTKYVRFSYVPWQSTIFIVFACIGMGFASLTCLVLSAMAISGLVAKGDYPSIVMAQEAIILAMVVAPACLSCTCSWSNDDGVESETSKFLNRHPIPYILFCLAAFIVRVSTTGFYLKEEYFDYYSDSKRNVYVLESSAVLIILLFYLLCFSFSFSFYTPLFKKRPQYTVPVEERLDYTAKEYAFICVWITVVGWKEDAIKDEESGDAAAAVTAT